MDFAQIDSISTLGRISRRRSRHFSEAALKLTPAAADGMNCARLMTWSDCSRFEFGRSLEMKTLILLLAMLGLNVAPTAPLKVEVVLASPSSFYLRWAMKPIAGFPACTSNQGRSCLLGFMLEDMTNGRVLGNPGYGGGNIGPTVTAFKYSLPCGSSTFSIDSVVVDGMGRQYASPRQFVSYTRTC